MAKKSLQEKEAQRLKEILKAYQREPKIYSVQSPSKEDLPPNLKSRVENLPQFNPQHLKLDLIKSFLLTLVSLGLILTAFFFLS